MKQVIALLLLLLPWLGHSQIYESTNGSISFYSEAPLQDVEAANHQIVSYYDLSTNYILFDVLVDAFEFDQALMQQRFNDRYLDSKTFPKAEFFGKVVGFDTESEGVQNVTAMGELTIHGVTQIVKSSGRMSMNSDGTISLISRFDINIEDFDIDAPRIFFHPVAETVDIKVEVRYHLTGS